MISIVTYSVVSSLFFHSSPHALTTLVLHENIRRNNYCTTLARCWRCAPPHCQRHAPWLSVCARANDYNARALRREVTEWIIDHLQQDIPALIEENVGSLEIYEVSFLCHSSPRKLSLVLCVGRKVAGFLHSSHRKTL